MQPVVKIYTLSTCMHCKDLKKFFDDCKVVYESQDVDLLSGKEQEEVLNYVRKINADCTFPTIVIGQRVVVGFKEKELREALGL